MSTIWLVIVLVLELVSRNVATVIQIDILTEENIQNNQLDKRLMLNTYSRNFIYVCNETWKCPLHTKMDCEMEHLVFQQEGNYGICKCPKHLVHIPGSWFECYNYTHLFAPCLYDAECSQHGGRCIRGTCGCDSDQVIVFKSASCMKKVSYLEDCEDSAQCILDNCQRYPCRCTGGQCNITVSDPIITKLQQSSPARDVLAIAVSVPIFILICMGSIYLRLGKLNRCFTSRLSLRENNISQVTLSGATHTSLDLPIQLQQSVVDTPPPLYDEIILQESQEKPEEPPPYNESLLQSQNCNTNMNPIVSGYANTNGLMLTNSNPTLVIAL